MNELTRSSLESVDWGLLIVTYPFISGLVAGSFVVSSLSHLFGQRRFASLAPLAVLVSLALLVTAPLTVLAHARQPSNFWELYARGHVPYSPIGDFTVIWTAYVVLLLVELYVVFRATFVRLGDGFGRRARLYRLLALGSRNGSEEGAARDRRITVVLSAVGIVFAFLFHGYIGFIFGSVKARPLWTTPLMPVLFIVSAIVSGLALMWLVYAIVRLWDRRPLDRAVSAGLLRYLVLFLLLDLFLDAVDFLNSAVPEYTQSDVASGFRRIYLGGPLTLSYLGVQLGIGIALPLLLWIVPWVRRSVFGGAAISLAVLVGVYAMRFNVVVGGQLQSKISKNLVEFHLSWFGYDSVQSVLGIVFLAALIFQVLAWVLPWREAALEHAPEGAREAQTAPLGAGAVALPGEVGGGQV